MRTFLITEEGLYRLTSSISKATLTLGSGPEGPMTNELLDALVSVGILQELGLGVGELQ